MIPPLSSHIELTEKEGAKGGQIVGGSRDRAVNGPRDQDEQSKIDQQEKGRGYVQEAEPFSGRSLVFQEGSQ